MLLLACGALTLAALLFVFWITPEPAPSPTGVEREREFLEERREVLYENLRDLHLEYRMGKLSDADYQQMKERYQQELAVLLYEKERLDQAPTPSADLSAEAHRAKAEVSWSETKEGLCPRCGRENSPGNRFCGACGAELPHRAGLA